jgi:hypothetical protein
MPAQKIKVLHVQGMIRLQCRAILGHRFQAQSQNFLFQFFFRRVGKFHAGVRKKFYPVVMVRIVGSGDNHAGLKIILPHQAGDSRCSNHSGKRDSGFRVLQTCGKQCRDVRSGFSGVHTDQNMRRPVFMPQISAQRAARRVQRRIVQRRSSGEAANSVGAKKFFCHKCLGQRGQVTSRSLA